MRALVPLLPCLGNAEVGDVLDEPLLLTGDGDLALTSDQWARLLSQRRAAGRPLHLAEVA